MKQTCLLKILPEYAEQILSKKKMYEYRRKCPDWFSPGTEVILVDSNDGDRLIGSFEVEAILAGVPEEIWKRTMGADSVISLSFLEYYAGQTTAFAFKVAKQKQPVDAFSIRYLLDRHCIVRSFLQLSAVETAIIERHLVPVT